jgi:hypothetical protein
MCPEAWRREHGKTARTDMALVMRLFIVPPSDLSQLPSMQGAPLVSPMV